MNKTRDEVMRKIRENIEKAERKHKLKGHSRFSLHGKVYWGLNERSAIKQYERETGLKATQKPERT